MKAITDWFYRMYLQKALATIFLLEKCFYLLDCSAYSTANVVMVASN